MTKGRDDVAERMNDLFALIRTRRQSGLLSVERYENGRFEEGEIHFQKGQPVEARVGNRAGQEALTQLLTWRQVYFSFSAHVSEGASPSTNSLSVSGALQSQRPQTQIARLPQPTRSNAYEQRPQKLVHEQNVMSLALTRTQRSLYSLVDGRRTIEDLARFMSKDVQEVYDLLLELRARGFITFQ